LEGDEDSGRIRSREGETVRQRILPTTVIIGLEPMIHAMAAWQAPSSKERG
jgi:hypothetical protein